MKTNNIEYYAIDRLGHMECNKLIYIQSSQCSLRFHFLVFYSVVDEGMARI